MVYRSGPRWTTLQRLEKDLPISFEQDSNEMSSHRSKRTLCNGYSHHSSLSLATLECHAQLVTAGQSCQTGSSTMRWGKCQKAQHNSASVRDCLRECGFVANLRQTQTPLPSRKCALELPTQFIGQRNCGAPVCVVDQQSGSVRELQPSGQTEANQHTFDKRCRLKSNCGSNLEPSCVDSAKKKSMGHVAEDGEGPRSMQVIFSTEVPQDAALERLKGSSDSAKGGDSKNRSNTMGEGLSGETYIFSSKKTQRVLQDQIRRVVVNLEDVLQGLKEVHLEMKEVVQQIDLLTSNIDLGEEDAKDTCGGSTRRGPASEEASKKIRSVGDNSGRPDSPPRNPSTVPRAYKRFQAVEKDQHERKTAPRLPPPAYPTGTNSSAPKSILGVPESTGAKSEAAKGPRSQKKPPPYPFSSRAGRAAKGKDAGLKTPPYSGRRKLLSTTV
ncbi:uncharacterized protein LOC118819165 [Colossoma macropomum]|uniref:uncharacterized protein LOC118819165 n=1 Tax=Colossoma macropomum TaxID=42526 RepID=UPI001863B4AC|nr:uncharacterized protein LOC118819165 [Colossoma macropomum]